MSGAGRVLGWLGLGALGLASALAGVVVSSSACGFMCRCPDIEPLEPGTFEITASPDRPELVGSLIEATDEGVEIQFEDEGGVSWTVRYGIDVRVPEDHE